jgi:hypothetical protein
MTSRVNKKWTVTELLSLQREYELLEMDIFDIALKHKRTPKAILYKLNDEGLIGDLSDARGYEKYSYDEEENIDDKLASVTSFSNDSMSNQSIINRISYLEDSMSSIKVILDNISSKLSSKSVKTREY